MHALSGTHSQDSSANAQNSIASEGPSSQRCPQHPNRAGHVQAKHRWATYAPSLQCALLGTSHQEEGNPPEISTLCYFFRQKLTKPTKKSGGRSTKAAVDGEAVCFFIHGRVSCGNIFKNNLAIIQNCSLVTPLQPSKQMDETIHPDFSCSVPVEGDVPNANSLGVQECPPKSLSGNEAWGGDECMRRENRPFLSVSLELKLSVTSAVPVGNKPK